MKHFRNLFPIFYLNFKLKDVFDLQETGVSVFFMQITVATYEKVVALTSNWLLSDCCLAADLDPYVISRLCPDSNSFSHICSSRDCRSFSQLARFLTCLMFDSLKHQSIVLSSHHFVSERRIADAIWSSLKKIKHFKLSHSLYDMSTVLIFAFLFAYLWLLFYERATCRVSP